ncbi:MAG: disulfide bond formation protein B [Gammaproteobacteria bacterium]|nr:disulfide bond formation protein B [Gammaproteobacteria bacterium]
MKNSNRPYYFLLFFICHELLVSAYYFEYFLGIEPCPLCMVSRATVFILGICFLIAALHNPKGLMRKIYHGVMSLVAALGVFISGRHTYLQSLPADEVPSCGPGLEYMLDTLPMSAVLKEVLHGSGECAEVSWKFLSFSMPVWMLLIFSGFLVLMLIPLFRREHNYSFSD